MGRFASASEGISEALAHFSSAEFGDANDVEEAVRALCDWTDDLKFTYFRLAGRLAETGLRESVADQVYEAGASALDIVGELEGLENFSIIRR